MNTTTDTNTEDLTCPKCGQGFASIKWLRRHQTVWGHKQEDGGKTKMTLPAQFSEPWAAGPDSPYDIPESCPECGSADAEFLPHESGCPSGYPTHDPYALHRSAWVDDNGVRQESPARDELGDAAREYEDEHPNEGPF